MSVRPTFCVLLFLLLLERANASHRTYIDAITKKSHIKSKKRDLVFIHICILWIVGINPHLFIIYYTV